MFQARELIMTQGLQNARNATKTKAERVCVDAAWSMLNTTEDSMIYTSRVVTSLPHKSGGDLNNWQQDTGDGVYRWDSTKSESGLPFGSKSRMILIHLLHTAVMSMNPTVVCGDTLYKWNAKIQNKSVGGMTYKIILDHAWRILQSRLLIDASSDEKDNGCSAIARATAVASNKVPTKIMLNSNLFQHVLDHLVPVRYPALELIKNNSAAIDLYIRLSDGLPKLDKPILATWPELKKRFGAGYKNIRQMKPAFLDTLSLVCAVYPEANITPDPDGFWLNPSPSSVDCLMSEESAMSVSSVG